MNSEELITLGKEPTASGKRSGHASVVHLKNQWFIVCPSSDVRDKPIAVMLMGTPMAVFRDGEGRVGALLDRCPHRNVPLSQGSVTPRKEGGQLQCAYHGWRFDREGTCKHIPSLSDERDPDVKARRAQAFPAIEQDGFVWVYATPMEAGAMPASRPYKFPLVGDPGYTTVRQVVQAEGTMHATIENALDVPHTAYLHRGLFRSKSRGISITAVVTRSRDRVVAEYVGEPRPPGIVGRMLSPSGGVVTHFDRFILPSIAEVEYRIGDENHVLVASAMTPVNDFLTRVYAVISFRMRIPGWLVKPLLQPIGLKIFSQDAKILKEQTENIKRFGGEQFASTEIDVLGRHIWRLMKAAERGDVLAPDELHEERIQLVV